MVRQNRVDYIRSSSLNREIALSTVLHVLVVLSAFIVLPTPEKISLPDYALPIDVITIDDFTRLTSHDPKPETKTDQAEEIEKQQALLQLQAPKVLFADAVSCSDKDILIGQLSTILQQNGVKDMGQNRLFAYLRENDLMYVLV